MSTPEERYPSSTGRFIFRIFAWEARMSLWIESFTLVEAASGASVFGLSDAAWSLDNAEWTSDTVVKMRLRKYPGDHTPSAFEVKLDCGARTAEIDGRAVESLEKVERALEASYRRGRSA